MTAEDEQSYYAAIKQLIAIQKTEEGDQGEEGMDNKITGVYHINHGTFPYDCFPLSISLQVTSSIMMTVVMFCLACMNQ